MSEKFKAYKRKLRWKSSIRKEGGRLHSMRTKCQRCGREIETAFGADPASMHQEAMGTADDPMAPGDYDNICAICNYRDGVRGGPVRPGDLAEGQQSAPGEWQPEGWQ